MYDFLPFTKPSATIAIPTSSAKTAVKTFSIMIMRFALQNQTSQQEYTLKNVFVIVFVTCIYECEYVTHEFPSFR